MKEGRSGFESFIHSFSIWFHVHSLHTHSFIGFFTCSSWWFKQAAGLGHFSHGISIGGRGKGCDALVLCMLFLFIMPHHLNYFEREEKDKCMIKRAKLIPFSPKGIPMQNPFLPSFSLSFFWNAKHIFIIWERKIMNEWIWVCVHSTQFNSTSPFSDNIYLDLALLDQKGGLSLLLLGLEGLLLFITVAWWQYLC